MAYDLKTVTDVAKQFADEVRLLYPLDKLYYLYGSYAKGCAREDSDADICLFFRDYCHKRRFDINVKLLGLTHKYCEKYSGLYLEAKVFETSDLNDDNPFVKEVLRTGIEIWPGRDSQED